jgi:hypothetical protein
LTTHVIVSSSGQYHTGRKVPIVRQRALSFGNYLTRKYAAPPATRDWTVVPAAAGPLSNIYLNDALGDCVVACGAHFEAILLASSAGISRTYTDAQILAQYSAIGGYIQGRPDTDNGCNMQTALDYWQQFGFAGGTKISAWMRVDPSDPIEVRAAINEFGCLFAGLSLPNDWVTPQAMNATHTGTVWDVAGPADPSKGHCVGFAGYDEKIVKVLTWGMVLGITDAAVEKYCSPGVEGELYAAVSTDWLVAATQKSPVGIDVSQMLADLDSFK